jgi:hypothetical protein
MHRSHALARYIARSICTLTVLKFVRKGWQAHCFTGLILTRLASSLPISLLAHRSNKIIHTISYETCGDPSPSCSTNTLLETRIHIHIYTYIYPKEKLDVHIRVSTCSYKLGCTHTSMRRVHVRASLNALVWHQRSTGEVRVLPQKKSLSAFTRNCALLLLYATSDAACDAHDNTCGTNITSTYCKQLSTYTFKSNRPRTSYRVFTPLVVTDGQCQTGKILPTPHVS